MAVHDTAIPNPPSGRVCFAGTHEPTFGRTALLMEGLRRRGWAVESCVEPAWGPTAERVRAARRGLRNPALLGHLAAAYGRLIPRLARIRPRPDVLLLGYPGQLDTIVLRALFPRARIVLDGFVSLDETLADRHIGGPSGATRRLARALDRLAFRLADRVLMDTAAHGRRFAAEYGLDPAKTVIVPVGARDPFNRQDAKDAQPYPYCLLPTAYCLTVLYFGGFVPLHGVGVILEAARLVGPDAGVQFELLGEGQEADAAEACLARIRPPQVRIRRCWMPEADLVAGPIAGADVCLGIFADAPKAMDVVPAKVYLAMACGKAVVTADTPAVREEVLARAGGDDPPLLLCPPGDPGALAAALLRLRDDPALCARMGAAARRLYDTYFTPEHIVEPLVRVIRNE